MLQKVYRFSVHYQLSLFLGLALAFSAGIAAVAAAVGNEDMAILTVFTPSLLAIVLTAVLSGRVGLSDLLSERFFYRLPSKWQVFTSD
jgi:cell shape-determining protein MreD